MCLLGIQTYIFTKCFADRIRPPQLNNTSPANAGGSPLLSGQPPRPPGLFKPPPSAKSHPATTPISGDGQCRTPEPIITRRSRHFVLAVILWVVILWSVNDPLAGIIDLKSAKQRASVENATLVFEKEKTERKREVMARERKLWEEAREARVPRGAFWDVVWPAWDCLAYGKREYWGILRNIPKGWGGLDACMNTPVEIKGVKIRRPDRCEGVFMFTEIQIRGYWVVDWDQPDCKPWYRDFEDKVGPNFDFFFFFLSLRIHPHSPLKRSARATTPGNVKSKLRSWASTTREDKTGACCVTAHHWCGT